jgi:molybdenum cofactor cytidylyltransferase
VCNQVVVVVGHDSDNVIVEIKKHLSAEETSKVIFVLNENYQAGMFTSLQCGLRKISQSDWILYHFVDQPSLPVSFYYELVEQSSENINWVQPAYKNKLGHPVLFNHNVADMILQLSENNSLRDLSNDQRITKHIWNCNYPQVLYDIDTIEQFNNLTI